MSKKKLFIEYVEKLIANTNEPIPDEVRIYWEAFREEGDKDKPLFTDNGKIVLGFMQTHPDMELVKAKDIAEALVLSSRTVSGAMRKLVTDGFVEKVATDPVVYTITEKGKNIEII